MIRTLNSLRFILILMIVISHSTLPISQDLINYLGEFPVAIFFVISGFVLSLSKGEKLQKEVLGNSQFFLSRIIKLYPLHILILAILILMDWRLGRILPWYQILSHSLLIQTWYQHMTLRLISMKLHGLFLILSSSILYLSIYTLGLCDIPGYTY
ncbi:acyltransferase family protein [Segatella copri]|uniref:acyltransferase family protein n=1 Tax=Segatella copri TaxID=165179 RepID=UPI0034617849